MAEGAGETLRTPIPERSSEEELALLASLQVELPSSILVVSDLHLGKGLEASTGRYFRRENFFADRAFKRFLSYYREETPGLLVLNGDVFDFLRIDDWPRDDAALNEWRKALARLGKDHTVEELENSVARHEKKFGLQTTEFKSLYKLKIIAHGHRDFFAALAEWISAGGSVLYVKGNHDLEQHWPLIRLALRDEIHQAGADAQAASDKVYFADEQWRAANLHLEHGHNYECLTRVRGLAELPNLPGHLRLPLGSFVNRYVVNRLERIEPFLDNIKPVTDVLWTLARRRPVSVFQIIRRGSRFLVRALVQRRIRHVLLAGAIVAAALAYLAPLVVGIAIILILVWPGFAAWLTSLPLLSSPAVRVVLAAAGALLPFVVAAAREVWHRLRRPRVGEDPVAAGVYQKLCESRSAGASGWRTQYAVLGHTHHQDVQELPPCGEGVERTLYVNSGTWAPLWPKNRPDLIGRTLYSFIRFTRGDGEYAHESLMWNDVAGEARAVLLLTGER